MEWNMMRNKRHFLAMTGLFPLRERSFLFNMIDANAMNHITVMKTTQEPLTKIFVSSCLTYIISFYFTFFSSRSKIFLNIELLYVETGAWMKLAL